MEKEELKQGLVWLPYTIVTKSPDDSPDTEYDNFMSEYDEKHKCCPKCGSVRHTTTLMAYLFNRDKKDEYKDENRCVCSDCGDTHTMHERNNPELIKNQNRFDKLKDILY